MTSPSMLLQPSTKAYSAFGGRDNALSMAGYFRQVRQKEDKPGRKPANLGHQMGCCTAKGTVAGTL